MVSSKDYYGILQVPPTASLEEIKKAYRKLALLYHPDTTTATSDIALHRFSEIKEAYQVLSNSSKRQEYHYKKFYTDYKAHVLVTPEIILLQIKELAALIAVLNPFRINYDTLYHQIILLLNDVSISILQKKNNRNLIESIVKNALTCTRVLPYHYAVTILQTLLTLVNGDATMVALIEKQAKQQRVQYQWNRYKILIAITIAVLLCLFFYFTQQ